MDQYLLIPFLVGWTSIYQLFWCELQGYKVLTHPHFWDFIWRQWFLLNCADTRCARGQLQIRHGRCLDDRQDDLDGLAWSFSEFLGIWHGQPESHLGIVVLVGGFAQVFGIICIYVYVYIYVYYIYVYYIYNIFILLVMPYFFVVKGFFLVDSTSTNFDSVFVVQASHLCAPMWGAFGPSRKYKEPPASPPPTMPQVNGERLAGLQL